MSPRIWLLIIILFIYISNLDPQQLRELISVLSVVEWDLTIKRVVLLVALLEALKLKHEIFLKIKDIELSRNLQLFFACTIYLISIVSFALLLMFIK